MQKGSASKSNKSTNARIQPLMENTEMIAMTNANMKNLPTTPVPAPEKTDDEVATKLTGTPVEKLAVKISERATDRLVKALDTTEDANGLPVFLKREGHETPEQYTARVEKMKNIVGPDRKIRNPPDTAK